MPADQPDLIVVGGGISGLSLAWKAAREGRRVLLLEKSARVGGCIHSEQGPGDYWFELGAHTAYNSYGGFLDVALGSGLEDQLIERGKARGKFGLLREGKYRWLSPPKVLLQLGWLEAALHAPFGLLRSKRGRTMAEYFGGLLGDRNYREVLSPFLAAVPSQSADGFPADGPGSLFKTRPRRKEILRSFGFKGGLQRVCDGAAATAGLIVERGMGVRAVSPSGEGFAVALEDGRSLQSALVAVAAPLEIAGELLKEAFPQICAALDAIQSVSIDSVGVVLPREKAWLPECAFVVPVGDSFFSCVTRDPFPDSTYRAFSFHFRPGLTREARLARICVVLKVGEADFLHLAEKHVALPSPAREHAEHVAAIDRALAGARLALTGNYFDGLAIEDCVQRSNAEWVRISSAAGPRR